MKISRRVIRSLCLFGLWLGLGLQAHAQTSTVTYIYTDPQGTPLAEADASGNVTARYDYTPYGNPVASLGAAPNGPGYTGHVNDPDTGLVYMQARYYDPQAHMLSPDPVGPTPGNIFGFNRYDYANNNPITNTDPTGMAPGDEDDNYRSAYPVGVTTFGGNGGNGTTTGQYIDQQAQAAADSGNDAATYAWAFAGTAWQYLGAESVSQVYVNGAASSKADMAMAAITLVTLGKGPEVVDAAEAIRGGVAAVRTGQEGEAAVRAAVDIGPKESITVAGRTRVPDGLITGIAGTPGVLSEVKNVKALSYTQQLRDYAAFAQQNNLRFDLYVRPGARLSAPLNQAIDNGLINRMDIPFK